MSTSRPVENRVALDNDVSLSRSCIWRISRDFYGERGLRAWTQDRIPEYITNNPLIAEVYARVVLGFMEDCELLGDARDLPPLKVLELGAGSGKFAYLFLRHIQSLLSARGLGFERLRYCMTYSSKTLVHSWSANNKLREFEEIGVLCFDHFQAGEPIQSSFLTASGSPLVVIANYVFDSLPSDAFWMKDGELFELTVTVTGDAGNPQQSAHSNLQISWQNAAVSRPHYADPVRNDILEAYRSRLSAATVLFPSHSLDVLEQLSGLADGKMLVMAADKGYAYEDQLLLCQGPPAFEAHASGCFSTMVNFDAIGKYFQVVGGEALLPDKHASGLNICAFLHGRPDNGFVATRAAYELMQTGFGPDDLFALLAWLHPHMEEMSVRQILSVLRLTRWDTTALVRLFPILSRQLGTVLAERYDLRKAIARIWANHFPLAQQDNELAFYCAMVLLELRFFKEALSMFQMSQQIFRPSAATSYNLALCHQALGQQAEALTCLTEAVKLDPQFEPARQLRAKLESEM